MKKVILVLIVLLIIAQFFRLQRNEGKTGGVNSIQNVVNVPQPVMAVLKTSCYDCHSNHTDYPWYTNIQPVGWWLTHHINEGKEELNFDEFKSYPLKKALHKLDETADVVRENEMPLKSYLIIHSDAKLSEAQRQLIADWAEQAEKQLSSF